MDLAKYAATAVLVEGRSLRSVGASTGRSKSWVRRHVQLIRRGGEEALVPLKRGPTSARNRTTPEVEDAIVAIRRSLVEDGYDAGSRSTRCHLAEIHNEVRPHQARGWPPMQAWRSLDKATSELADSRHSPRPESVTTTSTAEVR